MDLTFISGPIPLTKTITYNKRDDHYTTAPYPLIQRVTSSVQSVNTISDFAKALKVQGALGACLLKGMLDQPLVKESRAGHSMELPHPWIVFDFDRVDCAPTFEGALQAIGKYLPRECVDTDCIVQLSSSTCKPTTRSLSAHVFMFLDKPADTRALTDWLTWINFNSPLKDELGLTDSGMGLRFPLDRTVTSPAKLIYIAPPRCVGFTPSSTDLIRTYSGKRRSLKIPAFGAVPHDVLGSTINELRVKNNLPERSYRTRTLKDQEYMLDAEECVVHDVKPSGDGYLRLNLNGGDSHAYFINLREPGIIGNFKGEPYVMTAQAAPELFKALTKSAKSLPAKLPSASIEPLAFYATNRESTIYIGSYDREHDSLRIDPSTLTAAYSWLANFGVPLKQSLPHYDVTYDMNSPIRFEDGYPIINLYQQTEFLKEFSNIERKTKCEPNSLSLLQIKAPTLWRVMFSALGSSHEAAFYFVNWLAAIFQRRQRTMSAWILHGEQGTGKGLIVNYIIRPLFGDETVTQQLYSQINTNFNAYMEGRLFVVIDEADMSRTHDQTSIRSKLYDWITEPVISINAKGKNERDVDNTANLLLLSNSKRPAQIEKGDRRFNVGEFQAERLFVSPNELAALIDQRELKPLAKLLGSWQVNDDMLIRPYGGEAKEHIYEATHSLLDRIARAIHEGDSAFFIDNRPDAAQLRTDFSGKMLPIREYDALLTAMVERKLNVLVPSDLYVLFRMVAITDKVFPEIKAQQRQIYQRYGLLPTDKPLRCKRSGKTVRGVETPKWQTSVVLRAAVKEEDDTNIVPMRGKK
jgi:hypothetical protein